VENERKSNAVKIKKQLKALQVDSCSSLDEKMCYTCSGACVGGRDSYVVCAKPKCGKVYHRLCVETKDEALVSKLHFYI